LALAYQFKGTSPDYWMEADSELVATALAFLEEVSEAYGK